MMDRWDARADGMWASRTHDGPRGAKDWRGDGPLGAEDRRDYGPRGAEEWCGYRPCGAKDPNKMSPF